jgi:outer membrane protein OmpA-like peptidoglycan-associated protein
MKNKVHYFFLILAALLAAAAVILWINKPKSSSHVNKTTIDEGELKKDPNKNKPPIIDNIDKPVPDQTPEEILANLGVGLASVNPIDLLNQISDALNKGDMTKVSTLVGKDAMNVETFKLLQALTKQPLAIREIGEIELNKRARWAFETGEDNSNKKQIHFDFVEENGKWKIEKISSPDTKIDPNKNESIVDPLNLADTFVQAVLKQNFEVALQWVDRKSVSDTKIAALCILFEEGEYKLRENKPLRAMFQREDTVGYLANIEAKDGSEAAQFSLNMRLDAETKNWRVFEINLDQLLADYATRVAGGDIYYSPFVKNPAGGETLALYFEFNEDKMSRRTQRQLEIVAAILKSDAKKKITLSGHTDALGTKSYNDQLSSNRADVVRDFLAAAGVSAEQIVTIAKGASQPRRPNVTETGEDNPDGRRANRRTEIYLDF